MTRAWWVLLAGLLVGALAAACGGDDDAPSWRVSTPTPRPSAVVTTTVTPSPSDPEPVQLTISYINLMAPLAAVEADAAAAGETIDQRLEMVIAELKVLKPDIAVFSEVSSTKYSGKVIETLQKELRMEPAYQRANPWPARGSAASSDELAKSDELTKILGYHEGELVLVRDPFVILGWEHYELQPRSSELGGERRILLHMRLGGAPSSGEINLFVTHLTATDATRLQAQTADLLTLVEDLRDDRPSILVGDFASAPDSPAMESVVKASFVEAANAKQIATCCRAGILGDQAPLELRHDYIFGRAWAPATLKSFATKSRQRADGTMLWASDHDGLIATFELPPPVALQP